MKKSIKSAEKGWAVTGILSVFLTIVDQLCKVAAIQCLKGQKPKVLIPGVLELMYLENRGMAFGMLRENLLFCGCVRPFSGGSCICL